MGALEEDGSVPRGAAMPSTAGRTPVDAIT